MFGSKDLLFTSEKYGIAKSLRFRASAGTYLNRTAGSSATNQYIGTWSFWVKRGTLGANQRIFEGYTASTDAGAAAIEFGTDDCLYVGGWTVNWRVTTQVFRDPSSWYHFIVVFDTTQSTANNRVKVYVNGAQITSFSTTNNPTQNTTFGLNNNSTALQIGRRRITSSNDLLLDGYLAEVNFIDGQALTPSAFGFYDNNGIWQPAGYTGTYGTNGFYLKFTDVGATSGANSGYGKDFSGFNTNYWTTNNFGTTSTATTYDSMYDSPVNASNGITGIGNYCVLNPLYKHAGGGSGLSTSNGNLTFTGTTDYGAIAATLGVTSGKWYWEITPSSTLTAFEVGVIDPITAGTGSAALDSVGCAYYASNGTLNNNNSYTSSWGSTFTNGDVISVALDADNKKIWFGKNNTWQASGNPASGTNAAVTYTWTNPIFPALGDGASTAIPTGDANFGQRPFAYTPPSGFSALNTQNLSAPTISNGAANMAAVLYTGTGSSQTITASNTNSGNNPLGMTFQPDLVWIKSRSNAQDHKLTDVVRGTTKALISNSTATETTDTNGLTAFTTSGFTIGSDATYNTNTYTYVGWQWKAGGSVSANNNTNGSITSTVSANTTAGFSVLTYTGSGTASATIGHGLGVAPSMIIVKTRTNVADSWFVYHVSLGASNFLRMESTAAGSGTGQPWASTAPGSSVFTVGDNTGYANRSSTNFVAYCFAPVASYSSFGIYTGNGSADGPFIYTGFRPRFVMSKRTDSTGDWNMIDTSRSTYNITDNVIWANLANADSAGQGIDIISNGFKVRNTGAVSNTSGGTYIYAAFAENPFKISRAR